MKKNVMRSDVMMLLTDMNGRSSDDDAEASSTGPIEGESAGQQKPKKY